MALKFTVDSLDGVDEAFRPLYTEKDGKFTLGVEGAVASDKLDEFRTNNRVLKKQADDLAARFEGVDPEAYRAMKVEADEARGKKLIEEGKVEELFSERTAKMRDEHDKQIKAIAGERDAKQRQLEGLLVDGALRDAAIKAGVAPTAVDDVLLRGQQVFRVVDGKAVAMDGDKPLYGKDSEPLGVAEWVSGMQDRAPHWFPPSTGGGAPKGGSQATGGTGKTMTRAAFDALDTAAKHAAAKDTKIVD